jgi:hypothetical protein
MVTLAELVDCRGRLSSAIMVQRGMIMKRTFTAGVLVAALAFSAAAQDWYHDREERFRGEDWRPHIFMNVRTDLEHIWSAVRASDQERKRLETTKGELTKMQADLDQGRWDNGILNDMGLLSLRPDDSLTTHKNGFVNRLSGFSFLPPDYPSYRVSDCFPGGVDSR